MYKKVVQYIYKKGDEIMNHSILIKKVTLIILIIGISLVKIYNPVIAGPAEDFLHTKEITELIDAVEKNGATSPYGTIVAFSESPINEGLLVIGTDDGLVQITENGGSTWKKIDNIPGAPIQSYVNSVYLSQHDENLIYVAFNHHKYGDFKPYIFKSKDKGNTWNSISNNLPERGSVYAIEEDHEDPGLIFCGTEFGVFFSPNYGERWKKLSSGLIKKNL